MVADYGSRPSAEELSNAMGRSEEVLEEMIRSVTESVGSDKEARDVLVEAAATRAVDPSKVLRSIAFLEKSSRKGKRKDADEDANQAEELKKTIAGTWRLVFTTGTKGTQAKVGMINYFPLKVMLYVVYARPLSPVLHAPLLLHHYHDDGAIYLTLLLPSTYTYIPGSTSLLSYIIRIQKHHLPW